MRFFALVLALSALFVFGCGGEQQGSDEAQTPPATSESSASSAAEATHGGEMTVAGALGCGHCTYHIGDSCTAAVKTADGKVYILDVEENSELFTERLSGKAVTVVGSSHGHGGESDHFEVASYEMN